MFMRSLCLLCLNVVCMGFLTLSLHAQETQVDADALYAQAMQAMEAMNEDSAKSVEAAVLLYDAKQAYTQAKNWQRVREVQSYIFYCKKKMNINELDNYVAALGRDKGQRARQVFADIDQELSADMSDDDAALSFKDAEAFAAKNPQEFLKIHMWYLEISERAIKTNAELAIQASRKSSEALQEWVASRAPKEAASPFTKVKRGVTLFGQDAGFPLPNKKQQKEAESILSKQFGSELKRPQSNALSKQLLKMAKDSLDQPGYAYVCARKAAESALAKGVNDVSLMMQSVNFIAKHFGTEDIDALRISLAKSARSSVSKAVLTLLEDQSDVEANKIVGFSYCFIGNNWKQGLPMLEKGADPSLQKAIAMQKADPRKGIEQKQLADAWFEIASDRAYKDYETPILAHACKWYSKAKQQLRGISKEQVEARIQSVAGKLPVEGLAGVAALKVKTSIVKKSDWLRLRAPVVTVHSTGGKRFSGITLMQGQAIRVFPDIEGRWHLYEQRHSDYRGVSIADPSVSKEHQYGSIQVQVGDGPMISPEDVIIGEGKVYIFCFRAHYSTMSGGGTIDVKVAPVQ